MSRSWRDVLCAPVFAPLAERFLRDAIGGECIATKSGELIDQILILHSTDPRSVVHGELFLIPVDVDLQVGAHKQFTHSRSEDIGFHGVLQKNGRLPVRAQRPAWVECNGCLHSWTGDSQ